MCAKLDNMTVLIQRKCAKFVDQLISDGRFANLLFISSFDAFCNL